MSNHPSPYDQAQELDGFGFNVLPARHKGKVPQLPSWQRYQTERTTDKLKSWFAGSKPRNFWVATGRISGIVVLDCDSPEAEAYWRSLIGDEMDATTCVQTAKGQHYYFKIGDRPFPSFSHTEEQAQAGILFDVRGDGTGVIAPPSVHETGHVYEWIRRPDAMLEVPAALVGRGNDGRGGPAARSMLADLLSRPATHGGRNNWLTRVAGHYAKHFRTMQDAYEAHVRNANDDLEEPLPAEEVDKLIDSIWKAEQAKTDEGPEEANGYLVSGGDSILVQVRRKEGDRFVTDLAPWSDFDIIAVGVVEDENATRTYDVEIKRRRHGDSRRALLPAAKMARADSLAQWLGELGVGIMAPDNVYPKAGTIGERLRRYLEAQQPRHFKVVNSLGWHDDGFVTHEGVIRSTGLHGFGSRQPDPRLRNWAPYRYGFVDKKLARAILKEVLTFHDETVTSVFGAWWAACLLKPQIHDRTSQFPFMALEAPSESGKTTGFFSLMLQLNGNTQGQVDPTRAALRDWMSAHQSGIVWIDDLSDTQHLMDLLRQATGEGSVGKKGEDRSTQEVVQLVAPVVISGEALQLGGQKALVDRAVLLDVPSPTSRQSLKTPGRLQWADIVDLKERHPDLTEVAGTIVTMALDQQDIVDELPKLLPETGGRFGDKIAVLRMGARLLAEMAGEKSVIERVDCWCESQDATGSENTLTLKLVPMALAQLSWPHRPEKPNGRWPATPAFVTSDGIVWFSPAHLALWWAEMRHGRVEARTETAEALTQQAIALGLSQKKRWDLGGDRNRKSVYWALPSELSAIVRQRSRGEVPQKGVHVEQHRLALQAERTL